MRKSYFSMLLFVLAIGSNAWGGANDCTKTPDSLGCWAARQKNIQGTASTLDFSCATTAHASGGAASCWHRGFGHVIASGRLADDWTFSISNLKNPKKIEINSPDIYILDDEGLKYVSLYQTVYPQAKHPGAVVVPAVRLPQFSAPTDVSAQSRGVCAVDQGLLKCLLLDDNFKDYGRGMSPVSSWGQMRTFTKLKSVRSLVSANLDTFVIVDDGRVIQINTGGTDLSVTEYRLPRNAKATAVYGGGTNICVRMNVQGSEQVQCDGDDRWRQVTNLPKGYESQKILNVGLASDLIALETEAGVVFTGKANIESLKIPNEDFRAMRRLDGFDHYCLWHGREESKLTCWGSSR